MRKSIMPYFLEAAEDDASAILRSRENAELFARDGRKDRRVAAILALTYHHPLDQRTVFLLKSIVAGDSDPEMQAVAAIGLGALLSDTKDKVISRFLGEIAVDDERDVRVREAAYRALFSVHAVPLHLRPPVFGFDFQRDADWEFIRKQLC